MSHDALLIIKVFVGIIIIGCLFGLVWIASELIDIRKAHKRE